MLSVAQLLSTLQNEPVAASVTVAVLTIFVLWRAQAAHARPPKGAARSFATLSRPKSTLPLIGNTLDALAQQERIYDWCVEQHELHDGPWRLDLIGNPPTMVVSTPELFEDVLKTHFDVFPKGDAQCYNFRDVFGFGILAVNGAEWHAKRKAASQLFSLQTIRDTMHPIVQEKVQTLCETLKEYAARGQPISLKRVLNHFTMDVFARTGFGVDLHCLENGLKTDDENEFAYASRVASHGMQQRFHEPTWLWCLKRLLNIGTERELKENVRYIDSLVFDIVNASIEKKRAAKSTTTLAASKKDLVSIFLERSTATDDAEQARAIRDSVVNFIFAGTDTSAQSMSYLIVMLNRYPQVLVKIREELQQKLPKLMNGGGAEIVTHEDLSQLTYLEAAIRENLRLNPPAAITSRTASADVVLSDGTFVPKDTRVFLAFYVAMRSKAVWGDDALVFKPERWIDPITGGVMVESPFKFSAFLGGPRTCLGMNLAMMEMKMNVAVLLSKFELKTVEDPWKLTYEVAVASGVKGPLLVNVTPLRDGGAASSS